MTPVLMMFSLPSSMLCTTQTVKKLSCFPLLNARRVVSCEDGSAALLCAGKEKRRFVRGFSVAAGSISSSNCKSKRESGGHKHKGSKARKEYLCTSHTDILHKMHRNSRRRSITGRCGGSNAIRLFTSCGSVDESTVPSPAWTWQYEEPSRVIHGIPPSVMYYVIANVNDYSKFVPYCTRSHILRYSPHYGVETSSTMFDAVLTVGLFSDSCPDAIEHQESVSGRNHDDGSFIPPTRETYVSRVTLSHPIEKTDKGISMMDSAFFLESGKNDKSKEGCSGPWTVQAQSIQTGRNLLRSVSTLWTISPFEGTDNNNNNVANDNKDYRSSGCLVSFKVQMELSKNPEDDGNASAGSLKQYDRNFIVPPTSSIVNIDPLRAVRNMASNFALSPTILRPLLTKVAQQQSKAFEQRACQVFQEHRQHLQ